MYSKSPDPTCGAGSLRVGRGARQERIVENMMLILMSSLNQVYKKGDEKFRFDFSILQTEGCTHCEMCGHSVSDSVSYMTQQK